MAAPCERRGDRLCKRSLERCRGARWDLVLQLCSRGNLLDGALGGDYEPGVVRTPRTGCVVEVIMAS